MIIQGTTAYPAAPAAMPAASMRNNRQANAGTAASPAGTVSISRAARERLSASPTAAADAYPLEYYALPQWMGDFLPAASKLSGTLGAKVDELYAPGGSEQIRLHGPELAEYGERLNSHLQALLQSRGIDTPPGYHAAMIADQASSAALGQELQASMTSDPRTLELMNTLGIQKR